MDPSKYDTQKMTLNDFIGSRKSKHPYDYII